MVGGIARVEAPATDRPGHIGRSLLPPEDRELVLGRSPFLADIEPRDALRAVFVRNLQARGTIRSIDSAEARAMSGVVAVFTADDLDLPDLIPEEATGPALAMVRPHLARSAVRFAGEAVAVVVAVDLATAVDAALTVRIHVEPLPGILDPRRAMSNDDLLFPAVGTNVALRIIERHGPWDRRWPISISVNAINQRLAATPLEPVGVLAIPEAGPTLSVWCGHQAPHRLRRQLGTALHLAESDIRIRVPSVGGAFGLKGMLFPEYAVTAAAALRLGRPVLWIADRSEEIRGTMHARGHVARLTLSGEASGRIRRAELEILADLGAYPNGADLVRSTRLMATGPYDIPEVAIDATAVVTDKAPIGSYRGAGRPEAAYILERGIDAFARRVGRDPATVRRDNFIRPEVMPWRTPTGALYDGGRFSEALDRALALADEVDVRREQTERRAAGVDPIGLGIGVYLDRAGGDADSSEYARVEVERDGRVVIRTGSSASGQGHATVLRQVVADVLQVPIAATHVVAGDTAMVARGVGTFGSRSTQLGATAAHRAAIGVLDQARAVVAASLEARLADLELRDGGFQVAGVPSARMTLGDVATQLAGHGEVLAAEEDFNPLALTFPYGVFVAVVEVDVASGRVTVRHLVGVNDAGNVLNPALADAQVVGSALQGLGQAMSEGIEYDETGQLVTGSLMDYLIPSAMDMPRIDPGWLSTPAPSNDLGAKGIGESGCIGVPQALVNAVLDALAPWGVEDIDMPLQPARVWEAISQAADRQTGR
jgi:carbon-monoxide dehydrogenase large subunit